MPLLFLRKDITTIECDAIVNSTNTNLHPGGHGVDASIHSVAGPELLTECQSVGHVDIGQCVMTNAYNMKCKKIIHTAGPIWRGGNMNEEKHLRSCYLTSLNLAYKHNLETVAFPLISSGAFGYPKEKVLTVAVDAINEFLSQHEMTVYLALFDKKSFDINERINADISELFTSSKRKTNNLMRVECDNSIELYNRREFPANIQPIAKESICRTSKIREYLDGIDKQFSTVLFEYIDRKGMTDVECYKKANVSRQTWSKIVNDRNYTPSKKTAICLALALELSHEETQGLLAIVGYTLSKNIKFDKVISYFIKNGVYDIYDIEAALYKFDLQPLCVVA